MVGMVRRPVRVRAQLDQEAAVDEPLHHERRHVRQNGRMHDDANEDLAMKPYATAQLPGGVYSLSVRQPRSARPVKPKKARPHGAIFARLASG